MKKMDLEQHYVSMKDKIWERDLNGFEVNILNSSVVFAVK